MLRCFSLACFLAVGAMLSCCFSAQRREVWNLDEAQADPDFAVQGEYLGDGTLPEVGPCRVGAQVVARGEGKFEIFLLAGGLPGEGWKRGDRRLRLEAQRQDGVVVAGGSGLSGKISEGKFTLTPDSGGGEFVLTRVERKSPTLGQKPPDGAVVLLNGQSEEWFPGAQPGPEGSIFSGVTSKAAFDSYRLHLEFRLTWMPESRGQARSNSGVYVHNCYEIQVLDSFGLEGRDNECGGLYSIKEPDLNACLPPMVWQTYDIDLTAPKFDSDGNKVANARLTVRHNGVLIHDDLELPRATPGGQGEGPGPRAIMLQGHGCHVHYRNIWLVPKN